MDCVIFRIIRCVSWHAPEQNRVPHPTKAEHNMNPLTLQIQLAAALPRTDTINEAGGKAYALGPQADRSRNSPPPVA